MAEVKREQLEGIAREFLDVTITWDTGQRASNQRLLVAVLVDLEATAYARGLADGAERERAAVVAYLYTELGDSFDQQAIDVTMGKHLEQSE